MMLVPPISQYSNDYTITTARQLESHSRSPHAAHISYALPVQFFDNSSDSRNAFMVNTTTFVPDSDYHPIYCSNGEICGYGAYSSLPIGDHEVAYNVSGAAMMISVYGIRREDSFGYPAGFEMQAIGGKYVSFSNCTLNSVKINNVVPRISIFNVTVLESVGVVTIPINRTGGDLSLRSAIRASSRDVSASGEYIIIYNLVV